MKSKKEQTVLGIVPFLLAILIGIPAHAFDGKDLLVQIDRNLTPESYGMYRKLINVEPGDRTKEFVLFTVKKGADRIATLFISPASEKGRCNLSLSKGDSRIATQSR
jgi:hypothetical protein